MQELLIRHPQILEAVLQGNMSKHSHPGHTGNQLCYGVEPCLQTSFVEARRSPSVVLAMSLWAEGGMISQCNHSVSHTIVRSVISRVKRSCSPQRLLACGQGATPTKMSAFYVSCHSSRPSHILYPAYFTYSGFSRWLSCSRRDGPWLSQDMTLCVLPGHDLLTTFCLRCYQLLTLKWVSLYFEPSLSSTVKKLKTKLPNWKVLEKTWSWYQKERASITPCPGWLSLL